MKISNKTDNKRKENRYKGLELIVDELINGNSDTYAAAELKEDISNGSLKSVLNSFKLHGSLNPYIWDEDDEMDGQVRLQLLKIADDFIKFLNIKWITYDDIILTGSLANYNWSKYSDFDLHIVYDFEKVDKRKEFVAEYFNSKKNLWNSTHDGIEIYGYPVELYVQDKNEKHTATGIYSIEHDKWLKKPKRNVEDTEIDAAKIKKHTVEIAKKIDRLTASLKTKKDRHALETLFVKADAIYDNIYAMRKKSLSDNGEMSEGNIVFKSLRRLGYLDKLRNIHDTLFDKINSIEKR